MKMTLHIDEGLLASVMAATGATTKTQAIDLALREVARRAELKRLAHKGLEMSPNEIRNIFDPSYDLAATRVADVGVIHGRKSRSRR